MKVLITGVNGFVGRNIANVLTDSHEVIGIGRSPKVCPFEYKVVNICDEHLLNNLFQECKPDIVVNCAASLSSDLHDANLIDANVNGFKSLLSSSVVNNVKRFIQVSSLPIIGKPVNIPITEEHPVYPLSVYHLTKYFAEMLLEMSSLNSTVLRITSPIGEGMQENKILPVFIKKALQNDTITLLGKGERVQNYVDVRDVANSIALSIEKDVSGVFNIASDSSISNVELAKKCIQLLGSSSNIMFEKSDPEEENQWVISIEKAKEKLSFRPKYTLEESILSISRNFVC